MAHLYFESSALVKEYVAERGTAWVRATLAPNSGNVIHTALITGAEVVAAIARRSRASLSLSPITFVSADGALNAVAAAAGLTVNNPTTHT